MRREDLQDLKYVNRDGDSMRGPLALSGDPVLDAEAASKRYIDTVLANLRSLGMMRDGSVAMTGPLTLSGPPTLPLHAATRAYSDAVAAAAIVGLATVVYVDAQDVIDRAYADGLDAATRIYVDAQDVIDRAYTDTEIAGRATYDAIVAPAGGDYTSVAAACTGEARGAKIFIKSGTYLETAEIEMRQGQHLIGENPDTTIIDFGGGAFGIDYEMFMQGENAVRNLTVEGSIAAYTVNMNGANNRVDNCRLIGTAAGFSGLRIDSVAAVVSNCHFTGFSRVGEVCLRPGSFAVVYGCTFEASDAGLLFSSSGIAWGNVFRTMAAYQAFLAGAGAPAGSSLIGNQFLGNAPIIINVDMVTISGNLIDGATGIYWDAARDQATITGNTFYESLIDCDKTGSEECTIAGNTFIGGGGISCDGQRWSINGNTFQGTAGILLDTNSLECSVLGNSMYGSTAAVKITDNGNANLAMGNHGVPLISEKNYTRMENTSGGALVAGDVVVIKAVAAGDEFDTTLNQGDDMVLGMLDVNTNNAAFGPVQTEGFTDKLKVNGTAAIGIGDLLGTHTVAGIARQAAAGDMAFAIALEVYAGADSLGVIDALLIKPRKV